MNVTADLQLPSFRDPAVPADGLPWVEVAPGAPYFVLEDGRAWTPIGQNDAITWPELEGLFRRKDLPAVERHLAWLADHGVTCLRVMLEYAHGENRYIEKPVGRFQPNMVRLWDDFFAMAARHGLRLLLTPFDTFWMWIRWGKHPYNRRNGGPCARRGDWLCNRGMIEAAKARLTFAVERWGGNGALFAWDLWNEMHPAHMRDDPSGFFAVTAELSRHVRELEMRLFGRSHPQTVSLFGPVLESHPDVAETIFRHPDLDAASTHFYDAATIDWPRNTVDPAIKVGALVREALEHAPPDRPFFDSEHGPIHLFKDKRRVLPEAFDDEYFRHIQWAHLASGGAGGGMRWPNRRPHVLTPGMRRAQRAMAGFLPHIDWARFRRRNLNHELGLSSPAFAAFACGDGEQAVAWLLRTDALHDRGRLVNPTAPAVPVTLRLPGLRDGAYRVLAWDTQEGEARATLRAESVDGGLSVEVPPVVADLALAIGRETA